LHFGTAQPAIVVGFGSAGFLQTAAIEGESLLHLAAAGEPIGFEEGGREGFG
jgi:hypothetical protein